MRSYEKITQKHVIEAQQQWTHAIVTMDIDCLMSLYDYNCSDTPALFKPTLSSSIRSDAAGAAHISLAVTHSIQKTQVF